MGKKWCVGAFLTLIIAFMGLRTITQEESSLSATLKADYANFLAKEARVYADNFDYATALARVNQALVLQPENGILWALRGQVHLLLYEWMNALDDFNRAIELSPRYALAYFYRGNLHYILRDLESAKIDFTSYLTVAPNGNFATTARNSLVSIANEQNQ